ncbi:MAG: META domain-containing protein [Microthrixaceae bacterium]
MRRCATLLACIVVALSACGDDDVTERTDTSGADATASGAGVASDQLDGRSFRGTDVFGHDLVDGTEVAMTFEPGQLSTNAGCNTSGGAYTLDDGVLRSEGDWFTTSMACSPELEAQDQWLAQLLVDGVDVSLDGDVLTLTSADGGDVTMTLTSGDAELASLTGTTWMLTSIISGDAASSVPAGVDQPTLRIGEDGMAEIFAGCNRGGSAVGTTTTDAGEALSFGPIRLTRMACGEDAMSVEATVLSVFEAEPTFTISADRGLTLTAADGTGLEFQPA